jgi:Flp pilus assembly pilin Flp
MTSLLYRLLTDDEGQDLIEYMLLTATIAIGSVAALTSIGPAINAVYTGWDSETQRIWEPQAPAGS